MERQRFVVTARGSLDISSPYDMTVIIDDDGITLDGISMSWNDARAAIECADTIDRTHRVYFGNAPSPWLRGKRHERRGSE